MSKTESYWREQAREAQCRVDVLENLLSEQRGKLLVLQGQLASLLEAAGPFTGHLPLSVANAQRHKLRKAIEDIRGGASDGQPHCQEG